jgi:CheY-like chemotaxis protein
MLCDLHLGRGMDGYTFAEWARTQPQLAACPMLCMTAYFEDFDVDRARRCSFLAVIPKPISADTFVVQIEYYLPAEKRLVLEGRCMGVEHEVEDGLPISPLAERKL